MKPAGRTYCPRCAKGFIVFFESRKPEPWEAADPPEKADELVTTCPVCGGEMQVLELTDEAKEAVRRHREGEEPLE